MKDLKPEEVKNLFDDIIRSELEKYRLYKYIKSVNSETYE